MNCAKLSRCGGMETKSQATPTTSVGCRHSSFLHLVPTRGVSPRFLSPFAVKWGGEDTKSGRCSHLRFVSYQKPDRNSNKWTRILYRRIKTKKRMLIAESVDEQQN
eukprot:scaffold2322_cov135-Cylindrotheca_fusiformis.AAC.29